MIDDVKLGVVRRNNRTKYWERNTGLSFLWAREKLRYHINLGHPILIAGMPRHGKSYIACELGRMLGVKWCNTSDLIKEKARNLLPEESALADKESIRHLLIKVGDDLCKDDPGAIVRTMTGRGYRIIAGVRKPDELKSVLNLSPFVIWVDRPGHGTVSDNTLLTPDYCDLVLVNDANLESKLQALLYWEDPEEED
jgi:hypothetical protein